MYSASHEAFLLPSPTVWAQDITDSPCPSTPTCSMVALSWLQQLILHLTDFSSCSLFSSWFLCLCSVQAVGLQHRNPP